jgi:hypothetical protein
MGRVTTQIEHSTFNIQKQRMEGTKFCSLGCLVPWLFKKLQGEMSRFNPDFRHSERGCPKPQRVRTSLPPGIFPASTACHALRVGTTRAPPNRPSQTEYRKRAVQVWDG